MKNMNFYYKSVVQQSARWLISMEVGEMWG